ncbi:hypothetical protein ACFW04_011370 [Cataglyphis niger]
MNKSKIRKCLKIATRNVQSMYENGKAHNIVKEMSRLKVDIMEVSKHNDAFAIADNPNGYEYNTDIPPTADKDETTIEEFYEQLESLIKVTKKHEITLVIVIDFNTKVGKGRVHNIIGSFELGERNDWGSYLLLNTFFELPPRERKLYTWKSLADSLENRVRNQIDYSAVPKRFKNAIKSIKTYPGVNVPSDQNPIICKFEVKLKCLKKKLKK